VRASCRACLTRRRDERHAALEAAAAASALQDPELRAGLIEDVVWPAGSSRPELPLAVLVSRKTYKGPTLWHTEVTEPPPNFPKGMPIVPITPLKTTFEIDGKPITRTQVPLRLAWAVTGHRPQISSLNAQQDKTRFRKKGIFDWTHFRSLISGQGFRWYNDGRQRGLFLAYRN
jgi:hypothetical protein